MRAGHDDMTGGVVLSVTRRVTLAFSRSRVTPLVFGHGGGAGAPDLGALFFSGGDNDNYEMMRM